MSTALVSPEGMLVWYELPPQAVTEPSARNAKLCHEPTAILVTFVRFGGKLVWPALLSPHTATVASAFKARLCLAPAATATTFDRPTGMVTCLDALSPQPITVPSLF